MSTGNAPSRQMLANRHNAAFSTGPKTPEGKAVSSRNVLKAGLTGRTVLLPGDDAEAYDRHLQRFAADFGPVGDRETELVQSLADTQWRLNRIPALEAGIYALARIEMADLYPDEAPDSRAALIQARAYLAHSRQINNLHLQEARLRRHFEKDLAELRSLQADRKAAAAAAPMASNFQASAVPVPQSTAPGNRTANHVEMHEQTRTYSAASTPLA